MKQGISFWAAGNATSLLLAITFSRCVVFDLLFPEHAMYKAWIKLLPGFEWLSWNSYLLGLAESYGSGWYFTFRMPCLPVVNVPPDAGLLS
jgi:hypothetical protein